MSDNQDIRTVGIVGGGLMGAGIAELCAAKGYRTLVVKTSGRGLDTTRDAIAKSLQRAVTKGKIDQAEADARLERIEIGDDLNVDLEFRFASVIEDVLKLALGEDILDGKPKGHWYADDDKKKKK